MNTYELCFRNISKKKVNFFQEQTIAIEAHKDDNDDDASNDDGDAGNDNDASNDDDDAGNDDNHNDELVSGGDPDSGVHKEAMPSTYRLFAQVSSSS